MDNLKLVERDMTSAEFERMKRGFDEHALDNHVAVQGSDRFGFVAQAGDQFVGCVSGLAYKNGDAYSGWFYLTDLFVEAKHRRRGIGATLLAMLEQMLLQRGIDKIWTWTAGYEGPAFYKRQGYKIFAEMDKVVFQRRRSHWATQIFVDAKFSRQSCEVSCGLPKTYWITCWAAA